MVIYQIYFCKRITLYSGDLPNICVHVPVSALREHPSSSDLREPLSNSSICSENQNSKFLGFCSGQLVQRTINDEGRGGEKL